MIVHDEHGYYVPPEDPETLRHAIQHLLRNPDEARRMGQLGRQRIETEMSLTCYVQRFDEIIRRFTDTDSDMRPQQMQRVNVESIGRNNTTTPPAQASTS